MKVAEIYGEELFSRESSIIMTSATLTRKGKADSFKREVGVEDQRRRWCSPHLIMRIICRLELCLISRSHRVGTVQCTSKCLVKSIDSAARAIEGGTLALFTNYADLEFCYHNLRSLWSKLGRSVYAQGQGSHAQNYDRN